MGIRIRTQKTKRKRKICGPKLWLTTILDPKVECNELTKESLKQIIKEELDVIMFEAAGDPYDREYDLVQNNIKTVPA